MARLIGNACCLAGGVMRGRMLFLGVLVLGAGVFAASPVARGQTAFVLTSQMWGTETAEGKVAALVGIAGECRRLGTDLMYYFVSISLSNDAKCLLVASSWIEHLKLVSQTGNEMRWSGTQGPSGLAGAMSMTILLAKRILGDDWLKNALGPGPGDDWSYENTVVYSAPFPSGKVIPTTRTAVKMGVFTQRQSCRPTEAMLFAKSPWE